MGQQFAVRRRKERQGALRRLLLKEPRSPGAGRRREPLLRRWLDWPIASECPVALPAAVVVQPWRPTARGLREGTEARWGFLAAVSLREVVDSEWLARLFWFRRCSTIF